MSIRIEPISAPRILSLGCNPSEPQQKFLRANKIHICYGGARGGGKSWAMRTKCVLLATRFNGIKILLLRRTLPELQENHIMPLLALLSGYNICRYNESKKTFTFFNGSIIKLGYCDKEKDVYRYVGAEYDVVCLEEATHFTESMWQLLKTINRTVRTDFTPRMYYTCNPGNVGHAWIKRLFIDRDFNENEPPENYVFIPARVYDNKVLMERNPEYLNALKQLPEELRRAHLDGDWYVYQGQYFKSFRREMHVIDPFRIPETWSIYRAIDYGLDMLACYWAAVSPQGNAVIFRELASPNLIISEAAKHILEAGNEPCVCTFAPADMWDRQRVTGETQTELFAHSGLPLVKSANSRVNGWESLLEWLKPIPQADGGTYPRLRIFSTCRELIRTLPLLQHDTRNPSDVATKPHDITHFADALRCFVDGRPTGREEPSERKNFLQRDYDDQVQNFLDWEA
jgi:phage terminase large subunit